MNFVFVFGVVWFIRTAKAILFWFYLWQLKEYHIGRFLDHFRTTKGQRVFCNFLFGAKLMLAGAFFVLPSQFATALFILYALEALKAIFGIARGAVAKPVFTAKIIVLVAVAFAAAASTLAALFLTLADLPALFAFGLLMFDIFAPVIVSGIVLALQPFIALGRKRVIAKARNARKAFNGLTVVGITGSYGKTSTKEFLAAILSEKFKVLKTKEHQNSEVGVAECVLRELKPGHDIFIAEMGAYGRGGIKLICDMVKPEIGILTGINEQHTATFGSQENIIKTKFELIDALPEDGVAVVNWDNEYIAKNLNLKAKSYSEKLKIIRYSVRRREDIWAENIKVEKECITFNAFSKDGDNAEFWINALGAHYVPNLLAAAACAKELGMTMTEIAEQCKKITPELAGMTLKKGIGGVNIIDATYSANPDGVISHLEYLKVWPGRKIIIMPCLIELGSASKKAHQGIGRKIGEVCDLAIVTTRERFNDIKTGALGAPPSPRLRRASGMQEENILFLEKPKEILLKDLIAKIQRSFTEKELQKLEQDITNSNISGKSSLLNQIKQRREMLEEFQNSLNNLYK